MAKKTQKETRKYPLFGVVVGGIVVLGVVAIVATRPDKSPPFDPNVSVTVSGASLPELPTPPAPDSAIGMTAPELTGTAIDGSPISILNDGKPKVIVFLAHWCPHCQAEVPEVTRWFRENGPPQGIEMFSVATANTSSRPNYPPNVWLQRENYPVPTLVDSSDQVAARAYGLPGFPYWVIVGADGGVAARFSAPVGYKQMGELFERARAAGGTPRP